MKLFKE